MSNSAKSRLARIVSICGILLDLYAIRKIQQAAFGGENHAMNGWLWVLLACIAVSIPVFLYYYFIKARRWNSKDNIRR